MDEGKVAVVTIFADICLIVGRYGELLGEEYSEEEVVVRSTDTDRTLMSAQVSVAGNAQLLIHHQMSVESRECRECAHLIIRCH